MPPAYTHKQLAEVENMAAKMGCDEMEVRFGTGAPGVMRNLEAGPEGLEVLAFGPRHEGDGETVPGWWSD